MEVKGKKRMEPFVVDEHASKGNNFAGNASISIVGIY